MPLHGRYWARVDGILDMQLSFSCFRSQTMRPETEGFLIACQDQVIATRNNMRHIHKRHDVVDLCRVCGAPGENMDHIIACCPALARTAYIDRHNFVVQALHRALCKQHGLPSSKQLVQVTSSASCKLMWEIYIPTDRVIKANRPDLVLVLDDRALLLDVSVPLDHRVNEKVQEKISKYLPLAAELRRIWNKKITIVPVIIGALGGVSGTSRSHILSLGLHASVIQRLQQCAILGTLRIVRSVTGHGWESGMVGTVGWPYVSLPVMSRCVSVCVFYDCGASCAVWRAERPYAPSHVLSFSAYAVLSRLSLSCLECPMCSMLGVYYLSSSVIHDCDFMWVSKLVYLNFSLMKFIKIWFRIFFYLHWLVLHPWVIWIPVLCFMPPFKLSFSALGVNKVVIIRKGFAPQTLFLQIIAEVATTT